MKQAKEKCRECGGSVVSTTVDHDYKECGLSYVRLLDIPATKCESCGEEMVEIPAINQLHQLLSMRVAQAPRKFGAEEVRFLRSYMGWTNGEFATMMGVAEETTSRWASGASMGAPAERLLRMLVLLGRQDDPSIEDQQAAFRSQFRELLSKLNVDDAKLPGFLVRMHLDAAKGWMPDIAQA